MSYLENHKLSGIKVGDIVTILRTAYDDEMGWQNSWINDSMTDMVGKEVEILKDNDSGGFLIKCESGNKYSFPYFVLGKVGEKISNFNKTAELINDVYYAYENYEDSINRLNPTLELKCEDLNFDSFDFDYLKDKAIYYKKLTELNKQYEYKNYK